VTLRTSGSITDSDGNRSVWVGNFTTQIGQTPAEIQDTILDGGSIQNTYSSTFSLTVIPEPGTIGMMVGGLALLALGARRKR
jgi:hypothetical protein